MKILVTGATGFIGSNICRALVEQGHEVRAFHRSTSNQRLLEGLAVEHVEGDLTRPETLLPAMQGVEAVFHAAGMTGSPGRRLGRLYTVTVEGTRSVLQAARQCAVRRVVYTSSVAALGIPETRMQHDSYRSLITEYHTWTPAAHIWRYGYVRYLAEMEVQRAVAQGLDAVVVNPALVFGAGDIRRMSSSMVVKIARSNTPIMVDGGINVVHIDDVVAGHLAALELGKTGERYILGGENLSLVEIAEKIATIAGVNPPILLPSGAARFYSTLASLTPGTIQPLVTPELLPVIGYSLYYAIRKAQSVLQLPPPHPAEDALRDAYDWFVQMGAIQPKKHPKNPINE